MQYYSSNMDKLGTRLEDDQIVMFFTIVTTVHAIRNITFRNSCEFLRIFSNFYQKLQMSCIKFTY